MPQVKATTVADYLLQISRKESVPLTALKLMKLVYLCEGWSLALAGDSLLREEVEAWQYGPVIPDLYHNIKHYRAAPIHSVACDSEPLGDEQKGLITAVYNAYKHLTGIQLSDLTHEPGTPWSKVWDGRHNKVIPTALIRDHFNQLKEQRN